MEQYTSPINELDTIYLTPIKKSSFKKLLLFCLLSFVFCLMVGYLLLFTPPKDFQEGIIVTINEGETLREISKDFKNQNLIRSRMIFEAFVITYGGEKHILLGDYLFEEKLSVSEVARRISLGKRNLNPVKITIPEGFNINEIIQIVDIKISNFNKDIFLSLTKEKEGYLFPDTYFLFSTDNEEDLVKLMTDNYERKISPIREEIISLGKTEKEIITMASIIEREAIGDSDREFISGILWNRLNIDMPLQVDAAPITYKIKGLPEKPIGNPGLEAIKASMYPKNSPYIFYLHGKDGLIHYAKTFDEHKQNKFKYLK